MPTLCFFTIVNQNALAYFAINQPIKPALRNGTYFEIWEWKPLMLLGSNSSDAGNKDASSSASISLLDANDYLQLTFSENELNKQELVEFMQSAKPALKAFNKTNLLVVIGQNWNVNIDAWALLSRINFQKSHARIAVVSAAIHQALLVTKLARLNNNIKNFTDKKTAVQWLKNC